MTDNREVKSDVFSMLMEDKRYALQVYNAVNGTAYTDPELVQMTTLRKGISLSVRNDASIIVDSCLNLYEHQSTYSENLPLRSLIYLGDILKDYVDKMNLNLFGRKRVRIPTPKFFVFYNGTEKQPEKEEMRLSEAFMKPTKNPQVELICTVYNINPGNNEELMEHCGVLAEYTQFVERVRYYGQHNGNHTESAVEQAIALCIANNILVDFLTSRKSEVMKAMVLDMTHERQLELERRDALEEGLEKGRKELLNVMRSLVEDGTLTLESAASKLGMTPAQLQKEWTE